MSLPWLQQTKILGLKHFCLPPKPNLCFVKDTLLCYKGLIRQSVHQIFRWRRVSDSSKNYSYVHKTSGQWGVCHSPLGLFMDHTGLPWPWNQKQAFRVLFTHTSARTGWEEALCQRQPGLLKPKLGKTALCWLHQSNAVRLRSAELVQGLEEVGLVIQGDLLCLHSL